MFRFIFSKNQNNFNNYQNEVSSELQAQPQIENQIQTSEKETLSQQQKRIKPLNTGVITSPFGWRTHPTYGNKRFHDGIDIGVPINTPVKTISGGTVVKSEWYNGYGKYIEIDHGNGIHSFYGHLNTLDISKGDIVTKGQVIAKRGNTAGKGNNGKIMTTGPHLHFGMHKNGQPVNPLDYIGNF